MSEVDHETKINIQNPGSYADVLKAQEQGQTALPIDEARLVAYAMKGRVEEAIEYRKSAAENSGFNPLKVVKRLHANAKAKEAEGYSQNIADHYTKELKRHEAIRWYAPSKQLYSRAAERAEALGDNKLADEIRADFAQTPVEAVEHPREEPRNSIAVLIETVAGVLASEDPHAKTKYYDFTSGNNVPNYNHLTRAADGKGAQGEGEADTELVKKAFAVLGMEDVSSLPSQFDEAGHFALTWNNFKTKSMWKDKFIPTVELEDNSGRITVKAEYIPESTRASGEEVRYLPDHVDITISKHPFKAN